MRVLQILGYDEVKFNLPLVEMLSNTELRWDDEFYFATNQKKLYEKLQKNKNTIYFTDGIAHYINKIYQNYDLIVIQGWNETVLRASRLSKKAAPKIIWRFWGSDTFPWENAPRLRSRILGKLFFKKLSCLIDDFYGIGYGAPNDVDLIQKRFNLSKKIRGFRLSLTYHKGIGLTYRKAYQHALKKNNSCFRIMVGHSANIRDNHISILNKLAKFKDENIQIILVMSYGNQEYKTQVCKYATELFGNKVYIQYDMLPFAEYCDFIASIDVFITEATGSISLGNLSLIAYLGKKIFLKKDSFLSDYLIEKKVEHFYCENIEKLDFKEFSSKNFNYIHNHEAYLNLEDEYAPVNTHKELYSAFKKDRENEK
ncbi:MAG: TDP-N-acetylfucosamine:lipid II N-acetylfucosaminyltransferase [Erysipelotrichaceae bacterium]|nr:TDP-N-acetylfucosamine:lipid II N-acetylfucosaminyltransferase [Erysipelotrichaceae bacterium]